MSPIEQIKKGIVNMDWTTVCNGYEALTGEFLHTEQEPKTNDQARMALNKIARIIEDDKTITANTLPTKVTKKKPGRPKKSKKKTTNTTITNKDDPSIQFDEGNKTAVQKDVGGVRFITNDPDPEEVKKNKTKAIKAQQNKSKLDRKTTKTYDVICNECEKSFESDRPGGEIGQKCRRCLLGKKSRFDNG